MSKFSEELINITEAAILSDKLKPENYDNLPAISYRDYAEAEYSWDFIKNSEKNCYIQFGSNAAGMNSYGFYKANNGEIYIIEAWVNEITRIYIPTNKWDCLKNVLPDDCAAPKP